MFKRNLKGESKFDSPVFYRKRTNSQGDSEELTIGYSAVLVFKWISVLLTVVGAVAYGGASWPSMLRMLMKLV